MTTKSNGRDLVIKIDDVTIASVNGKTITRTREAVDTTNDDDNGWRSFLPEPGLRTIDLSIEGVADTTNYSTWLERWESNGLMENVSLEYDDGSVERGNFFLGSLVNAGESADKVTFSATLMSSGLITSSEAS